MRRTRWLTVVTLMATAGFVFASCGDDDGGAFTETGGEVAVDPAPASGDDDDQQPSGDESTSSGAVAEIDASAMPEPAHGEVEVDGEVLLYEPQDASDDRLFTCDLADDQITVNMQIPEGQDLLVQVQRLDTGEWAGSVVARDTDGGRFYQGLRSYGSESFAVDGPHMVFVGPFEYYTAEDRVNFVDAGEARISVTCP